VVAELGKDRLAHLSHGEREGGRAELGDDLAAEEFPEIAAARSRGLVVREFAGDGREVVALPIRFRASGPGAASLPGGPDG
jgi:hypothetical protein